ncbi:MAG: DUF4019 domain-containing protein [Geobacteraceae bacterium]|nr:DUF4019 domain-containing protein [Geobacteraceae bacterium]
MKTLTISLILGLSLVAAFHCSWADTGAEKAAISAAHTWLSVIDKGQYAKSWQEASAYFRGAISRNRWEASLAGVRKPLGRLVSRRAISSKRMRELPGAPDALYVVIRFRTSFGYKNSAVETVTFMMEKDGTWKAAGYFIQ